MEERRVVGVHGCIQERAAVGGEGERAERRAPDRIDEPHRILTHVRREPDLLPFARVDDERDREPRWVVDDVQVVDAV